MNKLSKKISKPFILLLTLLMLLVGCTSNNIPKDDNSEGQTSGEQSNVEQQQDEDDGLVLTREQKIVLGTLGGIDTYSDTAEQGEKAIAAAYKRIEEIENLMSTTIEGSDIYNINKNAGIEPTKLNPSTMEVILKGMEYYNTTKETFSIGLGSIIDLWGIGTNSQKVPSAEEIANAKKHIDLSQLEISEEDNTVFIKDANMSLNLGGIAKGYAVDEAIQILKEHNIESGLVNLGGDIFVFGKKDDDSLWRVGINGDEKDSNGHPITIARITTTDKSIVTSGDYERFFVKDDIKYHHIMDPKTGMPADSGVIGVTIVSDKCIDGDAIATAAFILGAEEGLELIESQPNVEGILVTKDKKIYASSGIKKDVDIFDDSYEMAN